jgi:hypothetical protein
MIEDISAVTLAPTKCRELSDSTARWGLSFCIAAKSRHSPAFEQGRAISISSPSLPSGAGPGGGGQSSTLPMSTHFTTVRSQRDTAGYRAPRRRMR